MGSRVTKLRKSLGLTQAQFAEKIGLKFSAISMIEVGKATLTEANIRLICLTFGVQEAWLRTGIGEMTDDNAVSSNREKQLLTLFQRLSPRAQGMMIEYAEKLASDEAILRGGAAFSEKESG